MKQHGCVLVFREGISKAEAAAALEQIADVLELPDTTPTYEYAEGSRRVTKMGSRPFMMADKIQEFDPEWGGPVWYIP